MKKIVFGVGSIILLVIGLHGTRLGNATAFESVPLSSAQVNLLPNGNMDDPNYPFYWRPTNHYVAGLWYEWWVGPDLPEFIDGGHPYHNQCYPPPTGPWCVHPTIPSSNDNHSQGYIRWGAPYIAGIYQPVSVTPCRYYRFEIYNRNDGSNYHPKIGIDPTGWQLPYTANPTPPDNCPPDGASPCPNPRLESIDDFPSTLVWSPEFDHAAYTWAAQSVVAEALAPVITVWTFVAPENDGNPSRSTYWDYGSLTAVSPPDNLLFSGVLPARDGNISQVISATAINAATFQWRTSAPAYSQVLYHYAGMAGSSLPPVVTATHQFELRADIDWTLKTDHSIRLQDLTPGAVYDVAIIAHRWTGDQCQTSAYLMRLVMPDMLVPVGALSPTSGINNVISTTVFNAARIQWQTADPTFSQILYHYAGPASSTNLPPIANNTQQYEFKTNISPASRTAHSFKLSHLQPLSTYDVALLSCRLVNDQCQTSIYLGRLWTTDLSVPAGALPAPSPEVVGPIVLPFDTSAYVIWQSPQPSYGQVLYHHIPPVTIPPTMTERVFLPLVAAVGNYGSTYHYEFRTWPITTPTTLHVVQLTGLFTDSLYSAVSLSAWSEGEQDKVAVSPSVTFRTQGGPVAQAMSIPPAQWIEQLQACLNRRGELAACVNELSR